MKNAVAPPGRVEAQARSALVGGGRRAPARLATPRAHPKTAGWQIATASPQLPRLLQARLGPT
eukprot:472673-Pyramimonas_sp.AAC.1